ncbi:hypothetical protein DMENIID0001_147070 [Sergentomyia squamirostris]
MRNFLNCYTLTERIFLVKTFYKKDCDVTNVKNEYMLEYGKLVDLPTKSLILEVVELFEKTGSVREIPDGQNEESRPSEDIQVKEAGEAVSEVNLEDSEKAVGKENDEGTGVPTNPKAKRRKVVIEPNQEDFICDICNMKFKAKRGIIRHLLVHRKKENITCKHCSESFTTIHSMRVHVKEFHKVETQRKKKSVVSCTICSKTFKQDNLRQHMIRHSDIKDQICEVCGKAFKRKHTLTHHMKIHTGQKPYKCDFPNCDRAFRDSNSYAIHKRCHLDERPFPCNYCGKCFRDRGTLRIHYRQHTGEHPYKCELCGKETKQKQNLKSHMMHFHRLDKNKI